jgi:acetylornithine/succinyldiaminopimelate/putrescine aminotransferase
MMALQTHSDEQGIALARQSIENGVLAIFANNRRSALIVMPPLVISQDEVGEVLTGLDAALSAMAD